MNAGTVNYCGIFSGGKSATDDEVDVCGSEMNLYLLRAVSARGVERGGDLARKC